MPWKIRQRANTRAEQVRRTLRKAGLTYHRIRLGRKVNDTSVTITPRADKFVNRYTRGAHEFGHMLGLGDEYTHARGVKDPVTGHWVVEPDPATGGTRMKKAWVTKATHYGLVETALGADYAAATEKVHAPARAPYDPVVNREKEELPAGIMGAGSDVRMQHYVTIWEALAQVTAQKAAVPTPKFGQADWKFVGG